MKQYSMIRLCTNKYKELGVNEGTLGIVLEVYDDMGYEVEFSRDDGSTIAWFAVEPDEIEPYEAEIDDEIDTNDVNSSKI